ncbi:MAG: hypothetical protein J6P30_01825 [Fibrobacter sp.]|nr:hypothetical protein [Fibrobacter sp.]
MNHNSDKISNNTASGYNVRITPRSMELLGEVKQKLAKETGVNQPFSAIVGELIHTKAVDMGIANKADET